MDSITTPALCGFDGGAARASLVGDDHLVSKPIMFVCTYTGFVEGPCVGVKEATAALCAELVRQDAARMRAGASTAIVEESRLLAVNSNYGHAVATGQEARLKRARAPGPGGPRQQRPRQLQGDGTCFNSSAQCDIAIDFPGIPPDKVYRVKYFSTTGQVQIPGVLLPDMSDGHAVLVAFVALLNRVGFTEVRRPAPADAVYRGWMRPEKLPEPKLLLPPAAAADDEGIDIGTGAIEELPSHGRFRIAREGPNMLNFKMIVRLGRRTIHREQLAEFLAAYERREPPREFSGLEPPYPIREVRPPTKDLNVTLRFEDPDRAPASRRNKVQGIRVNIYQGGRINILGSKSREFAERVHCFIAELFSRGWDLITAELPRTDAEIAREAAEIAAAAAAAAAAARAAAAAAELAARRAEEARRWQQQALELEPLLTELLRE